MNRSNARRLASKMMRQAEARTAWLKSGIRECTYSPAALRAERDLFVDVAVELSRLGTAKKRKQVVK